MCMNCGCGLPEDRQGNDANITYSDLQKAAQANHMSVDETIQNMMSEARTLEVQGSGGSAGSTATDFGNTGGSSGTRY